MFPYRTRAIVLSALPSFLRPTLPQARGSPAADAKRGAAPPRPLLVACRTARPGSGHLAAGRLTFELRLFGRTAERGGGRLAALDGLRHGVEIARTHFALVLDRGKAQLGGGELFLLQFDKGAHLA